MTEGYGYSRLYEEKYYIRDSRQYVGNCLLWWRKDKCGYTTNLDDAGRFTKEEAEKICLNRDTDVMYLVDDIDNIAERHVDSQRLEK